MNGWDEFISQMTGAAGMFYFLLGLEGYLPGMFLAGGWAVVAVSRIAVAAAISKKQAENDQ